jgi:hypothetical protein
MNVFTWRTRGLAVPVQAIVLAAVALTFGEGCQKPSKNQTSPASGSAAVKRLGHLHTYKFKILPGAGTAPCTIAPDGVKTVDKDGKEVTPTYCKDDQNKDDPNCVHAVRTRKDEVRFEVSPTSYSLLVVFDPFKHGTFVSGTDYPVDQKTPSLPAGKAYSFNVLEASYTCAALDPKIRIDP